ncbi:ROK family glucokinase [Kribbia dieselivorans]|uniref:ROK family glucokinase n=1 Tax=Kribbia dieselivorans TaxID=331526 RepID=UPI000837DE46|nr:ROK family glucokinase [Kribbia dieselivorans]
MTEAVAGGATAIGIDIGGTKIAGGLVSSDGRILARARQESPATDPEALVTTTADIIVELRARVGEFPEYSEPATVGVACAGLIDSTGSLVYFAPNLAWRDMPFRALVQERVGLPTILENDANAAAWGEFRFGAGRDVDDFVLVTVGTGIGGGCIVDGRMLHGGFGIGGELGHIRFVKDGVRCGCGNRGCWEAYASGTALEREAREVVSSGSAQSPHLVALCDGDPEKLTGQMVDAAAVAGDAGAIELLEEIGYRLGEGMASIAAVLDPSMFGLGGGVMAGAGQFLLDPIRSAFGRSLIGRGHRPTPAIVPALLGNDAGVIGAAAWAHQELG